jgi:hypothetical protein
MATTNGQTVGPVKVEEGIARLVADAQTIDQGPASHLNSVIPYHKYKPRLPKIWSVELGQRLYPMFSLV